MRFTFFLLLASFFFGCETNDVEFAIVMHGGAGTILKKNMSDEMEKEYIKKMDEALSVGYDILKNNGKSIDAVEAAIKILENSELFNAGKGSVLSNAGIVEMDASIMRGDDLNAGAISGVKTIKNPISAARLVMENSEHVFLSGNGAESFAESKNLEIIDNEYFITNSRLNSFLNGEINDKASAGKSASEIRFSYSFLTWLNPVAVKKKTTVYNAYLYIVFIYNLTSLYLKQLTS